jgi:hypothetical protein
LSTQSEERRNYCDFNVVVQSAHAIEAKQASTRFLPLRPPLISWALLLPKKQQSLLMTEMNPLCSIQK